MTRAATIRARREATGLTQAALAAAVGVRSQYVQHWEHGRRRPGGKYAAALVRVLGGAIDDYLGVAEKGSGARDAIECSRPDPPLNKPTTTVKKGNYA